MSGNVLIQGKRLSDRTIIEEVKTTDEGLLITQPFDYSVANNKVPGWRIFRKFAMNPDIDAGTEQIWPLGTIQVLPTTAAVASVTSDDAADDVGGTGALTLKILGLDENYVEVEETVTLTGAVAVTTTQTFLRIYRAFIVLVGTGGVNAGNITINVGGNTQAYIEAGEGQTHISQYTVPADHTLLLPNLVTTVGRVGNADISVQWQARNYNVLSNANYEGWRSLLDVFPYEGAVTLTNTVQLVSERTDIRVIIVSTATNSNCHVDYSGFLVDNNFL